MSIYALIICFFLYCFVAFSNFKQKDYPHAFIWASYALSQLGFLWHEFNKLKS